MTCHVLSLGLFYKPWAGPKCKHECLVVLVISWGLEWSTLQFIFHLASFATPSLFNYELCATYKNFWTLIRLVQPILPCVWVAKQIHFFPTLLLCHHGLIVIHVWYLQRIWMCFLPTRPLRNSCFCLFTCLSFQGRDMKAIWCYCFAGLLLDFSHLPSQVTFSIHFIFLQLPSTFCHPREGTECAHCSMFSKILRSWGKNLLSEGGVWKCLFSFNLQKNTIYRACFGSPLSRQKTLSYF